MTDKKEKNSDYYDNVYKQYKHYSLDVDGYHTCYTQLYLFVKNLLQKEEKILELGCGTGQFAEILINEGYNYKFGIDFSEYAIQLSKERCKINLFMKYDLYDLEISKIDFDTIIALEVFEHLENDIKIINSIPSKKRVIFNVPSYNDTSHVRFFKEPDDVEKRFKPEFNFFKINELGKIYIIEGIK